MRKVMQISVRLQVNDESKRMMKSGLADGGLCRDWGEWKRESEVEQFSRNAFVKPHSFLPTLASFVREGRLEQALLLLLLYGEGR